MKTSDTDQAGQQYWNQAWDATPLPGLWPIESQKIGAHVERSLFDFMSSAFTEHGMANKNKELIEVGCARSAVLPLFAKKLGFKVAGIDYSPNGCEQTRLMLQREAVPGEICCCDIFSVPDELVGRFDVVVSFGLIEHFTDTTAIVTALSRLLKPGGLMFTNIPNMNGMTGFAQRFLDKAVYDIHVPLTSEVMREAHEHAGLKIVACNYFLSTNFGVVNLNSLRVHSLEWWAKKIMLAVLARISIGVWWWESLLGRLPTSNAFSPYVNCLAIKQK